MTYVWLLIAICFEVGWAVSLKLSRGFTVLVPTIATVVMYLLSVGFLAMATRRMDVGVGYALWAGSGVAMVAIICAMVFKEPMDAMRTVSIALIVLGIAGLGWAEGKTANSKAANQQMNSPER
jgi:multidrug transporter EmrE-like cation transporter